MAAHDGGGPVREDSPAPVFRGTNQAGMRAANERLVLSLVRDAGALSKTEIARLTGLSTQTISVIMRALERDALLQRGEPQRGRVGQPSVPLSLDPDGAFFIGAKIGRRSLEVVLVDFTGNLRHRSSTAYAYPTPDRTITLILEAVAASQAILGPMAPRIAGLGLAMPFELWTWAEEIGAPSDDMSSWRDVDIRTEVAARLPFPVYMQNDATAACGAELAFGSHAGLQDFLYVYIGAFIGGGLVVDGALFVGRTGNAAALGSMPVPDGAGGTVQLLERASLVILERRLRARGQSAEALFDMRSDWAELQPEVDRWIAGAAAGIAQAVASALALIDFEAVVIDGAMPSEVRDRLVAATDVALNRLDLAGLQRPTLRPGTIGPIARALGGASLPLFERYLIGKHTRGLATTPLPEPA